jgi:hypothetical protein
MASQSYDPTRDPRTGRPPLAADADKAKREGDEASETSGNEERRAIEQAQRELDASSEGRRTVAPTPEGERPEALAQFGQSAREENSGKSPKDMVADDETAPIPTDNPTKHDVATKLLNDGAHGREPDPDAAGEDQLPDRIVRKR